MLRRLGASLLTLIAATCLLSSGALAGPCPVTQSDPAFTAGGSVFGRVKEQWNQYFRAKVDANNGILCNPTIIGGSVPGSFTIRAGLTNAQGTRNTGANTISSGATLSQQLIPTGKSAPYIVNSDFGGTSDTGAFLISSAISVTFTLPQPSSGTKGLTYQFGSNGTYGFTLTTAALTANFYGCAGPNAGAHLYTFGANIDVSIVDDGTNYKCSIEGTASPIPTCGAGTLAYTDCVQSWTKPQRGAQAAVALSTSTFTTDLNVSQHFSFALNHAACPCAIANPSNLSGAPGQVGMMKIVQSATGSDIVTWGSVFKFAGGTTPTLSTSANAVDYLSYYVDDATHVLVAAGALNAH